MEARIELPKKCIRRKNRNKIRMVRAHEKDGHVRSLPGDGGKQVAVQRVALQENEWQSVAPFVLPARSLDGTMLSGLDLPRFGSSLM